MSARDQISDYLLGELDAADRARFEAALETDAWLAAEVARLRPVVARLDALEPAAWAPLPDLPPLVALPPEPAREAAPPRPARPARTGWWRRSLTLRPLPAGALAAALLALGIAAGLLLGGGDDEGGSSGGRVLALAPVEPLGGAAAGTARLAADRATVHLTGLPPSKDGEFYELWLLNGPEDLVSLGSFSVPASGEIDVTVPVPGDAKSFAAIDVSVEPPDGDPAHSKQSVLRAPLQAS